MTITIMEYAKEAHSFAAYPKGMGVSYVSNALIEELGELHGVVAKAIRAGNVINTDAFVKEAGDLLWQLCEAAFLLDEHRLLKNWKSRAEELGPFNEWTLAHQTTMLARGLVGGRYRPATADVVAELARRVEAEVAVDLEVVMEANLKKLRDRAKRGVIVGRGDDR